MTARKIPLNSGADGTGYSVTTPAGVTSPILPLPASANQASPFAVTAMPSGSLPAVGTGYSWIPPPSTSRPAAGLVAASSTA